MIRISNLFREPLMNRTVNIERLLSNLSTVGIGLLQRIGSGPATEYQMIRS